MASKSGKTGSSGRFGARYGRVSRRRVAEIEADDGEAFVLEADVSDEDEVENMIDAFEKREGAVDVLVNNAGILTQSELAEMPVEMWDETIAVDLRGVFLATRFALP